MGGQLKALKIIFLVTVKQKNWSYLGAVITLVIIILKESNELRHASKQRIIDKCLYNVA